MNITTLLQGAHRGGTSLLHAMPPTAATALGQSLCVADPLPARAATLAQTAARRWPMVDVAAVEAPGVRVVGQVAPRGTLLLASDTASSLVDSLAQKVLTQAALWQIVGRGPGGTAGMRFALQGTLVAHDQPGTTESLALLQTFAALAPPASSRALTATDALTAQVLTPLRDAATRQTAMQFGMLHRAPDDLPHGAITLHGGVKPYPVRVRAVEGLSATERRTVALEVAGEVPARQRADRGPLGGFVVVAVVSVSVARVELHTVSLRAADRRRTEGLTVLAPPVSADNDPLRRPAVLTD